MSAFLDRLERELVDAARRDTPQPTASLSRRSILIALSVAAIVTAALLTATINHRAPTRIARGPAQAPGSSSLARGGMASHTVTPSVSVVNCDFALQGPQRDLPRLVVNTQSPGAAVVDHVRVLRRPQDTPDHLDLADLDRGRLGVVEIYSRYSRLLHGPLGESIELVPALICPHSHHHPLLALLAITVGRPRMTLLWATAGQLAGGGRTIQFRSGGERVSATILADGRMQILVAPSADRASGVTPGLAA